MKEIICYSKKYGNQTALIDEEDYESINKYRWTLQRHKLITKDTNDEIKFKFYAQCGKLKISMHQMILGKAKKGSVKIPFRLWDTQI